MQGAAPAVDGENPINLVGPGYALLERIDTRTYGV
jgi:hypothetical protein